MNANELLAYNQGYNAGLKAGIDLNTEPMLRQQQAEIEALKELNTMLKDAIEKRIEMDANRYRFIQNFAEEQHQRAVALEIQALHQILGYEGVAVGKEYLDECVEDLRKAQK